MASRTSGTQFTNDVSSDPASEAAHPASDAVAPSACSLCEAERIASWPYVHCWRCGKREDRPDLGLNAEGGPL